MMELARQSRVRLFQNGAFTTGIYVLMKRYNKEAAANLEESDDKELPL